MKNEIIKVLVLHSLDVNIDLIKNTIGNSVFVIAKSKAAFMKKMDWIKPTLIIADLEIADFSGINAMLFVKQIFPNIPFLYVINPCILEAAQAEVSDGNITIDKMEDLEQLIESILEEKFAQREEELILENLISENEKLLRKAEAYLKQWDDFEHQIFIDGLTSTINNIQMN